MVRLAWASVVAALLLVSACGDDYGGGKPSAFVGTYDVTIASGGKTDSDVMHVSLGSNGNLLLNFLAGISQVRCVVTSATNLTILSQTVHIEHSTGVADGTAGGRGSIAADGTVSIELDLGGKAVADAGATSGMAVYTITGKRTSTTN